MSDSEEEIVSRKTQRAIIDSSSDDHSSDEETIIQSSKLTECISENESSTIHDVFPKAISSISSENHQEHDVFIGQIQSHVSGEENSIQSKSPKNPVKQSSDEEFQVDDKRKSPEKSSSKISSDHSDSKKSLDTDAIETDNHNLNRLTVSGSPSNLAGKKINKIAASSDDSDMDFEKNKSTKETISNPIELHIYSDKNENKLKPKKYKLLSDGDLSDDESDNVHTTSSKSLINNDSVHEDLKNINAGCQKEKIRKKKLQKLNVLKRMEMERAKSANFSDSENEQISSKTSPSIPKISKKKKKDQKNFVEHNSSRSSSPSVSEAKHKGKTYLNSHKSSKRKQQVDPKLEIKSKTQKMIREKKVSLPYHQPKKHSLDEFLQRRKNIPSMPLKPTANSLALVDEHLAKREEESVNFFKSESDHTDTEDAEKTNEQPVTLDSSSMKPGRIVVDDINADVARESNLCDNIRENCTNNDESSSGVCNSENANNIQVTRSSEDIDESEDMQSTAEPSQLIANTEIPKEITAEEIEKSSSNEIISTDLQNENVVAVFKNQETANREADSKSSNQKKCVKGSDTPLPDSEDFELQIEDSCPDTDTAPLKCVPEKNKSIEEKKVELRNHKLALLSRLNVPLRRNVKLNADPDTVIELGESPPLKPGILELQKKFADHTTAQIKDAKKEAIKMSIINVVKGSSINTEDRMKDIVNESELENELEQNLAKPGLKYAFFKEKLKQTLVIRKQAQWKEYQTEKEKLYNPSLTNNDDIDDFGDKKINSKPNFEPYHPEEEPDDDDLLEDDIIIDDREKKRNKFVDDEAEVSYDEDENIIGLDAEDSDVDEDDEEGKSRESETENEIEEDDRKNAEDEKDVCEEAEDSDGIVHEVSSNTPRTNYDFKKSPSIAPIFKYNITATDLENKVLGLDNIFTQKETLNDFSGSQAFEICSGKFATQRERLNVSDMSEAEFLMNSQIVEDSQNINLVLEDTKDEQCNDEANISVERSTFLLSDESDTEELFVKKKKLMRLEDSDDEIDNPVRVEDIDLEKNLKEVNEIEENVDSDEDVEEEAAIDELDDEIGYNSEEEIITNANAAEFFENEAELSESEWGSEDENEQDLDVLEKEAGDEDNIDQEKLKEELGKIHMRQLLDDDQNDVRILQEMLLEDGELHSDNKRERKFQWKGLDDNGFFLTNANDSDEELTINDENDERDEQWRKVRHEREMYISQQEKKDDLLLQLNEDEDCDGNSLPLVKFPHINRSSILLKSGKKNETASPELKHPLHSKFKCGSFLSRSKLLLNRLATTVSESKDNVVGGPKNSRNFVFAAISPERQLPKTNLEKTEKRKISSKSVMASKKLKFAVANGPIKNSGLLTQLSQME